MVVSLPVSRHPQIIALRVALERILNFYHVSNILLAVTFLVLRTVPPFCSYLFHSCTLNFAESQVILFTLCVTVVKNRKAIDWVSYLKTFCMLAKLANCYLFYKSNILYCIIFTTVAFLHILLVNEPVYRGPDKCIFWTDRQFEQELFEARRGNVKATSRNLLVCFFTPFSDASRSFSPIFSQLSVMYDLPNFKFIRVDVNRYPTVPARFGIDSKLWNKQLPTLILFENGQEVTRRPFVDERNRILPFKFANDNIEEAFDLPTVFDECKKAWKKQQAARGVLEIGSRKHVAAESVLKASGEGEALDAVENNDPAAKKTN